eukprot:1137584-Pelagomonas_calceolata.AAC.7
MADGTHGVVNCLTLPTYLAQLSMQLRATQAAKVRGPCHSKHEKAPYCRWHKHTVVKHAPQPTLHSCPPPATQTAKVLALCHSERERVL